MTAITLALLALAANPLPDNKIPIDSLSYSFSSGGGNGDRVGRLFGPAGHLSISKDGKVGYSHQTAPDTGSGGIVTQKSWELTKDELKELFAKLVADGFLDAEGPAGAALPGEMRVTSGRWHATLPAQRVPNKAFAHLRPLLAKAHPVLWGEKPAVKEPPVPKPGVLNSFGYYHAPKLNGDQITLYVMRDGKVSYRRYGHPNGPNAGKTFADERWTIPAKDAETLLDALATDGLLDLEEAKADQFPLHRAEAQVGRWQTTFYAKAWPEKIAKHIRPLLRKADAEFWK